MQRNRNTDNNKDADNTDKKQYNADKKQYNKDKNLDNKNNMHQKDLPLLIKIAKKTGLYSEMKITTGALSKECGISQQSVSRKLAELEDKRLILRSASVDGIRIRLSEDGIIELKAIYSDLNSLFEKQGRSFVLKGKVVSGLGEGRFYTGLSRYKKQFIEKLGIKPYPGTLNIKIKEEEKDSFSFCRTPIIVDGFSAKDRTYGAIKCYPATLFGIKIAVIIPDRTNHKIGIVEIISEKYLRKTFKLKDNDEVVIK